MLSIILALALEIQDYSHIIISVFRILSDKQLRLNSIWLTNGGGHHVDVLHRRTMPD
jgi:hypothetical protein